MGAGVTMEKQSVPVVENCAYSSNVPLVYYVTLPRPPWLPPEETAVTLEDRVMEALTGYPQRTPVIAKAIRAGTSSVGYALGRLHKQGKCQRKKTRGGHALLYWR